MENLRISIENKYTLICTFAIEIQMDKLFTLVSITSINEFSCKYFSIKCSSVYLLSKKITSQQSVFNTPIWFRVLQCQLPVSFNLLISVENMNLLPSSIYKHLKINLIEHKQSLILGKCGSQLISVFSNTKMYIKVNAKTMLTLLVGIRRSSD